jgi:hypothetical protein
MSFQDSERHSQALGQDAELEFVPVNIFPVEVAMQLPIRPIFE